MAVKCLNYLCKLNLDNKCKLKEPEIKIVRFNIDRRLKARNIEVECLSKNED